MVSAPASAGGAAVALLLLLRAAAENATVAPRSAEEGRAWYRHGLDLDPFEFGLPAPLNHHKKVQPKFVENPVPVVVVPFPQHYEGLGSSLMYLRKSLAYALELDLPWAGRLVNSHDNADYAATLGLCQPYCNHVLDDFDRVVVDVDLSDYGRGVYAVPPNLQRPTMLVVSESYDKEFDLFARRNVDALNTDAVKKQRHNYFKARNEERADVLVKLGERFRSVALGQLRCPERPYLIVHFREGDVDATDNRWVEWHRGDVQAVKVLRHVLSMCDLDVKLMSEGAAAEGHFGALFRGDFEYIDGRRSSLPFDLQLAACASVLVAYYSSFAVLAAVLAHGVNNRSVAIAHRSHQRRDKFDGLDWVLHSGREADEGDDESDELPEDVRDAITARLLEDLPEVCRV